MLAADQMHNRPPADPLVKPLSRAPGVVAGMSPAVTGRSTPKSPMQSIMLNDLSNEEDSVISDPKPTASSMLQPDVPTQVYEAWLEHALETAHSTARAGPTDKQLMSHPIPATASSSRDSAPPALMEILSGIHLPGTGMATDWGLWVMDLAYTIAPSGLACIIEQEAHLTPALAGLVASTALCALAEGL
jgi:hypothetical protein